jgi:hypothetical protein
LRKKYRADLTNFGNSKTEGGSSIALATKQINGNGINEISRKQLRKLVLLKNGKKKSRRSKTANFSHTPKIVSSATETGSNEED